MISRWIRSWYGRFLSPPVDVLRRLGVRPAALTFLGLTAEIAAGALLALDHWAAGVSALIAGQVLDSLDGELARRTGQDSPLGGFLDSISDHYGDMAVYLGLLWHFLQRGAQLEPLLIFLALFGSVFGSHVRSRAGMAGVDTKRVGLFTRFERTVVILAGIVFNQLTIALIVLAFFTNFSALQRVVYTLRTDRARQSMARG